MAADQIIGGLAKRKAALVGTRKIDIKVNGWDDDGGAPVFVSYGPVGGALVEAAQEASLIAKDFQTKLAANADILIEACRGVYQKVNGKRVGFDPAKPEHLPKFDADLAKVLDLAGEPPAVQICEALFLDELDLLAHASQLAVFSGAKLAEIDETLAGE